MPSKRKQLSYCGLREVLLVAGPPDLLAKLEPWLEIKRRRYDLRTLIMYPERGDTFEDKDPRLLGVSAFFVVCSGGPAPSKLLPGLGLKDADGRFVVGSALMVSPRKARAFASGAASVEKRADLEKDAGPALLLGEWEPRARKMAWRSKRCFDEAGIACFQWTADRVARESLSYGLSTGAGLALYYGHGRSVGWAGYYGYRARHLPSNLVDPIGAVFSITCSTASRGGSGLSFSERLVGSGVCAASLGATRRTRHLSNAYLASSLCEAIAAGATRVHEAIYSAMLPEDILFSSYRIFGDPTALMVGSADSEALAARVYAPAPEEDYDPRKSLGQTCPVFPPKISRDDVDLAELIGL